MSDIVIVVVEGLLTVHHDLRDAAPERMPLRLVHSLAETFPIGYVTYGPVETAEAWLRVVRAPQWAWVCRFGPDLSWSIARQLGERKDRAAFVIAGSPDGFDNLASLQIPTMLYRSERNVLGDWKPESSWENEDDDEAVVRWGRGGVTSQDVVGPGG